MGVLDYQPTEHQLKVLEGIFIGKLNIRASCKQAGISTVAYYKWFANPEFVGWYDLTRTFYIMGRLAKVDSNMLDIAEGNDRNSVAAAKLVYEKAGEINQDKEVQPTTITINVHQIENKAEVVNEGN